MGLFGPIKTELYEIDGGEKYEEMGHRSGDDRLDLDGRHPSGIYQLQASAKHRRSLQGEE